MQRSVEGFILSNNSNLDSSLDFYFSYLNRKSEMIKNREDSKRQDKDVDIDKLNRDFYMYKLFLNNREEALKIINLEFLKRNLSPDPIDDVIKKKLSVVFSDRDTLKSYELVDANGDKHNFFEMIEEVFHGMTQKCRDELVEYINSITTDP